MSSSTIDNERIMSNGGNEVEMEPQEGTLQKLAKALEISGTDESTNATESYEGKQTKLRNTSDPRYLRMAGITLLNSSALSMRVNIYSSYSHSLSKLTYIFFIELQILD